MFQKNKMSSIIGPDFKVDGDISINGNIIVYGEVRGNVICDGLLTMSKKAVIIGDIKTSNADISGTIEGDLRAKEKISIIAAIKDKYINDWDQPSNLIKYPIKGTIINWPKDPAAITIPRDKVLFSTLTDLPTAPNTTAVPHPAPPIPNKAWDPIISNELFTFDIHARPRITKVIPSKDARPDPYLSDNAPNSGEPTPTINTCKAAANPKSSLPVLR